MDDMKLIDRPEAIGVITLDNGKVVDGNELHALILGTARAITSYSIEARGKVWEDRALIIAARDLIDKTMTLLLPSGDPCTRCHGTGVEPTKK